MSFQNYEESEKVSEICDNIHAVIKNSKLDFTIQQTPYSSYVTIRRKIQKNVTSEALNHVIENTKNVNNVSSFDLKAKLKNHKDENEKLLSQSLNFLLRFKQDQGSKRRGDQYFVLFYI